MKFQFSILIMTTGILLACSSGNKAGKDPQADPRSLAEAIFEAAKSGNYEGLAALIDVDADNDSKMIASVATDQAMQAEFRKYFSGGKVSGEPMISGEKASVNILFGPDANTQETFEMVKRNGKWYLQSF